MTYSDKQKNTFAELAQKVGIGRAIKDLGYPNSWATGRDWCEARGVKPSVDTVMANAKKFHLFLDNQDAMLIAEEGMAVVRDKFVSEVDMTPDDIKKCSESFQKLANTWLVLQGKAASITETQTKDGGVDLEILDLLNAERAKNTLREKT